MPTTPSAFDEADLEAFGWGPHWEALGAKGIGSGLEPGIVVQHDGVAVLVVTRTGLAHVSLIRSIEAVAVGDRVLVDEAVREVLDRTSLLQRRDPTTGRGQLIAANVDVVTIVCGLDRPVRSGRIERFVAIARDAGAEPLIVCTKADLVPRDTLDSLVGEAGDAAPGTPVFAVSSITGDGLDAVRSALTGRTVVLVGESGVGKSTLLNALAGQARAKTGANRVGDAKGRHTTTARHLHVFDDFRVIDTPGVREVGLWAGVDAVDTAFDDIEELAVACRFNDCAHGAEPGCAVTAAVDDGTLPATRLESWRQLRIEAAASELRDDPVTARRSGKLHGRMAREAQRTKRQR